MSILRIHPILLLRFAMLTQLFSHYFPAIAVQKQQRDEERMRELEQWIQAQITDLDRWVEEQFPLPEPPLEPQPVSVMTSQFCPPV
ncbi:MAG: hypothetical protein VKJ24_20850 [Synechococcales bacterium]|nr:hypothetical protein [Synechococcales bacterium]